MSEKETFYRFVLIPIILIIVVGIVILIIHRIDKALDENASDEACDKLDSFNYYIEVTKYINCLFGESYGFHRDQQASLQIVSNFSSYKQFEYLIKYFGLALNDETVSNLQQLKRYVNKAIRTANESGNKRVSRYIFSEIPSLKMYYISPKGNSKTSFTVKLTPQKINELIENTNKILQKQENSGYQRAKLTPQIRDSILARDNWTCRICGNSVYKEPNLLLEVDHIVPLSKGGKTEPNNLQTLCWRCNRKKSDNVVYPK